MTESHEFGALTKAFSGFGIGVEEKSLISILGKWHPEQRKSFRKGVREFFTEDERQFERWDDRHIARLEREFLRFKNAMVLWTMHPWERDARMAREALIRGPSKSYGVLIEIACSRSSEELLGARKAYHSLFERSLEEDVAAHVSGGERKLLAALVSSYRYEGPRVSEETAKAEAKILSSAIKNAVKKKPIEDEEVVRILTTRSKLHIKAIAQHYKEISGNNIEEDLAADLSLKETVQCLYTPQAYYNKEEYLKMITERQKVLEGVFQNGIDEKEALSRVIVTRADVDIKKIKEEYHKSYGVELTKKIEDTVNGNYRDFLLTLVARGD